MSRVKREEPTAADATMISRKSEPLAFPPIGLSRAQAAAYVGMGISLFDQLVDSGHLPKPRQAQGRLIWHRREVEEAFADLPFKGEEIAAPKPTGNSWAMAEARGRAR